MSAIRRVTAFIRPERASEVLRALDGTKACRVYVCHVHAHGAGVDPDDVRFSLEEEEGYSEKVRIEVLCEEERARHVVAAVRSSASTGHRGDGVIVVSPVEQIVNVRTGDRSGLALL